MCRTLVQDNICQSLSLPVVLQEVLKLGRVAPGREVWGCVCVGVCRKALCGNRPVRFLAAPWWQRDSPDVSRQRTHSPSSSEVSVGGVWTSLSKGSR